jgi:small-conductance mechanosensitive channel
MLSRGLLTVGAGALLYVAAVDAEFVSLTGKSFAFRLWIGSAMFVLIWNYAQGVFSPRKREWRVVQCNSSAAGLLRTMFVAVFGLFVVDRILAAGFELTEAGIELTLAQAALGNGLFAVLLWLLLSPKLWHNEDPPATDAADEPVKARPVWPHAVLRSTGRLLAVLILVANALAYIRLSNFVFHRGVLLAVFLILVWSVHVLAVWGLSLLPAAKPAGADAPGVDEDSAKEHLGFWLNLALGLTLLALSVPAFLVIVGFDWLDVRRWFALLSADIQIGAVSVSFTAILTGVVVFLLVSTGTRWVTSVVDKKLLKPTGLDTGERDSIMTLVNYAGVVTGILIALAIVGVGLSRLAIVAGALSVGIGFGLQSIVNNFVSGLILLFERPIKMGDWVVVPSGQGYVKHIGARATEIQTFDRASILVPNSELVSSAVQNWFYKGRRGRLRVAVGVSYGSDPEQVRDILLDCAKKHPSISSYPAASVRWTDFGESSLDFELRAFVKNIDDSYEVRSDLRFAIFKAFKDADVEIPFPQRDLHIRREQDE